MVLALSLAFLHLLNHLFWHSFETFLYFFSAAVVVQRSRAKHVLILKFSGSRPDGPFERVLGIRTSFTDVDRKVRFLRHLIPTKFALLIPF